MYDNTGFKVFLIITRRDKRVIRFKWWSKLLESTPPIKPNLILNKFSVQKRKMWSSSIQYDLFPEVFIVELGPRFRRVRVDYCGMVITSSRNHQVSTHTHTHYVVIPKSFNIQNVSKIPGTSYKDVHLHLTIFT